MQEPVGQEAQPVPSVTRMDTLKYAWPRGGTGEKGKSLLINVEAGGSSPATKWVSAQFRGHCYLALALKTACPVGRDARDERNMEPGRATSWLTEVHSSVVRGMDSRF